MHQDTNKSPDLALSDLIELEARRDLFAAAPASFGCAVMDVPGTGATLMRVPGMPTPSMNRVVGLRGVAPLAGQTLAWMRAAFRDGGIDAFWLHAWDLPGDAALQASYATHGLALDGQAAWVKFLCNHDGPLPALPGNPALHVRPARPDEAAVSGAIVCRSFGMAPAMAPWMGAVVGRPGWQVFFACDEHSVPVATAAMFIDGPRVWLGMGATLPEARQQGSQQMLLAARIAAARAAGCTVAGIETEAPPAGGVQHSLNNVRRAGFRAIGRRFNYLCSSVATAF